eukprot:CAMPEP_0197487018 /NCGR_PEP_ID=MMETSP1311-20131121/2022_1 /TAXON_ID=464262 /ORGANISM="Genus nov. species nov., Strain RCC856" /LENGTH=417 /DNA_ID=CAMNT_0043030463 /DNA_START=181 /DNA_END=1434 /DNA_ORIENTATION=+
MMEERPKNAQEEARRASRDAGPAPAPSSAPEDKENGCANDAAAAPAAKKQKQAGGGAPAPAGAPGKEGEEALRNLRSLHRLLGDLEQEMKVFQNVSLPIGDAAQELAHGMARAQSADPFPAYVESKKRTNLAIASEYDKLKLELDKSYTQQIQISEGDLYTLQRSLFNVVHYHARYVAFICALLAKKPAWVSENKYSMVYDFVESDNPFSNDKVDALVNASGLLSIIQDDKVADQFHFDERQKGVLNKCYGMLTRFEDMLICIVNLGMTIDDSIATLLKTYLKPAMESPGGAEAEVVQDIQKMMNEISQIEESLLEGLPVSETATKGETLGILVFKAVCQAIIWFQVEFYCNSFVLSEYGPKSPPILNPLQSAACCLHISNTIRKTLFQDLLYKTTSIVQEGEQRDKENPTPVKHSS